MNRYKVKYMETSGSTNTATTYITASSASEAREKMKDRLHGKVKIISVVKE